MSFRALFLNFSLLLFACGGSTVQNPAPPELVASPPPPAESADAPGAPGALPSSATANDRCASPRLLALVNGKLELNDETKTASDEFSTLDCASRGTADTLVGPQRYYQLSVRRGRTYRFTLTPSFHAVVYGFDGSVACNEGAIRNACRSAGVDGFASGLINPGTGKPGATVFAVPPPFQPQRDMDLTLVVDSDGAAGSFSLTIVEE